MKNIAILFSLSALVASGCSVIGATLPAGGQCTTNSDCIHSAAMRDQRVYGHD